MFFSRKKLEIPTARDGAQGAPEPIPTAKTPFHQQAGAERPVSRRALETAIFGLGCFWGAERKFWEMGDGI